MGMSMMWPQINKIIITQYSVSSSYQAIPEKLPLPSIMHPRTREKKAIRTPQGLTVYPSTWNFYTFSID
ncbi:hypothetical protein DMENIID0001_032590 [Sergentomyia squamirostris]